MCSALTARLAVRRWVEPVEQGAASDAQREARRTGRPLDYAALELKKHQVTCCGRQPLIAGSAGHCHT